MPREGWKSVTLPVDLVVKIDEVIGKKPSMWKSRAEVIKYAVRRLLNKEGWKLVTLPEGLVVKIDEVIGKKPSMWKSRAEVITYAVRRLLNIHGAEP